MTNEQFDSLVSRLEKQAHNNPRGYQIKVLLLAVLGNAYMGAMLLLIVALLVALVVSLTVFKAFAIKLIIILGLFLWMILKALWVKIDPPTGAEIRADQAPALFSIIDGLRRQLGAPRFHHVLINDEFNAGVMQSPRLGIFGWHCNYLLIGLPLIKSLTVEQFTAVLAHEFGHLAKGHGRMSNWIYRQRLRWTRLLAVLEANESKGRFLFMPFLNWFAPYFNAYSFPLARANEYEADAISVRLTSSQTAAEALTGISVIDRYLAEKYWPQIFKKADEQQHPVTPYCGMGRSLATELDEVPGQSWLNQELAMQTDSADTHPALHDRLEKIGAPPLLALPAAGQAADRLLGNALEVITERIDRQWQENVSSAWKERYQEVQGGRHRLAELNAQLAGGAVLTVEEAYDRARLSETIGNNPADALAQFRALNERAPDDPVVCFSLGAHLLRHDDAAGSSFVERAMSLDANIITSGCELLRDFHWRNGRKDDAQAWHQRLVERLQIEEAAAKERNELSLDDKFEYHGLSDEALARLRDGLQSVHGLRCAYFVKKCVRHLEEIPCYVLGYRVSGFFQLHSKRRAQEVLREIKELECFPGETIIVNVEGDNYRFGRKLRWRYGARIV
jgi:Zn-dependent protease with chaperone function